MHWNAPIAVQCECLIACDQIKTQQRPFLLCPVILLFIMNVTNTIQEKADFCMYVMYLFLIGHDRSNASKLIIVVFGTTITRTSQDFMLSF